MVLRVLEPTSASQFLLETNWWLDLELTNCVFDDLVSNTVLLSASLVPTSTSFGTVFTKLLKSFAASVNGARAKPGSTLLRLVFSKVSGYAARSDFLVYRFQGARDVQSAVSFLEPLCVVNGVSTERPTELRTAEELMGLFQNSIGIVVGTTSSDTKGVELLRGRLDDEFSRRLSVPWIIPHSLTRSRVFWVQGRADIESSRQFYQAARALGITIVVLDQPGHWLEDDRGPHAHYREAFIPVNVDGDYGLTQRIIDAVRSYPHKIDGIVTISDVRLPFVARACEILGLSTSPSAAYFLAGDKGATRELESDAAQKKEGFVLNSADELDAILAKEVEALSYPLIVKPCSGWNSDCVSKVRNRDELYAAVHRASSRHANSPLSSTKVVVEPYVDGPEVDANFIILDGEVLFCDISDDFPSLGDHTDDETSATAANFMETLMDVPTNLPAEEQEVLRDGLTRSISNLGFHSGIFHCEARVRNSRARYQQTAGRLVDLRVVEPVVPNQKPSCYLHEVNARSPGYINCVAALLAYGIDYYAVRLLLSLGPRENQRVRILAQPFLGNKPQYTLGVVVLPPTRAGIMASADAVEDFLVANPAIRKHVVHHQILRKKGEFVDGPDSNELLAVGYIIVASRRGREECLELAQKIRGSFDYKLEAE